MSAAYHAPNSQLGALPERRYTLINDMNAFSVLTLFLLQAQDATQPAPSTSIVSASALTDMAHNLGPIAIGVLVVLLIASLQSWKGTDWMRPGKRSFCGARLRETARAVCL